MIKKVLFRLRGRVLTLYPKGSVRGRVLLSHDITPFFRPANDPLGNHGNYWTARYIAQTFLERNYIVDVINWENTTFTPRKKYAYFIDIHNNLERLAPLLGSECTKILHITASHWLFQNTAEYLRCLDIKNRRGAVVQPRRLSAPSRAIEAADYATIFGNDVTISTYAYAGKPIVKTPMPSTDTFPNPETKDFEKARKNFLWIGGTGAAHKGLDLVLEAFAGMPDMELTICSKVTGEDDFVRAYHRELYELPNIKLIGYVDTGSDAFKTLCSQSIGTVFASCSEGQAGSVVLAMNAGLIPIISRESGVDLPSCGVILKENTVSEIKAEVQRVAALTPDVLRSQATTIWGYAREHYGRATFARAYDTLIDSLEARNKQ
jgi:glycosyltransferase involved in cell wall biosynthesis